MIAMREWMLPLICSAIIVVIQIIFAPILTIFSVVPSFIVAFVLVLSVLRRPDSTYGYAFVLGLVADLLSQTPVGLTSLLLLAITFVLSRVFEVLDDTSITILLLRLRQQFSFLNLFLYLCCSLSVIRVALSSCSCSGFFLLPL